MSKSVFPIRVFGLVGVIVLLVVVLVDPVGAIAPLYQTTPEPSPRPTVTPAPSIVLNPNRGMVGADNQTTVTGYFFTLNLAVTFVFDITPMEVLEPVTWNPVDGTFTAVVRIPPQAGAGAHTIVARQADGTSAAATYELLNPTPSNTPPPTETFTPAPPTDTPPPSSTPTPSLTPTPSPTLRPVTPMVTITPIPPTKAPTRAATRPPSATRTSTPRPGTPTPTYTPSITPTFTDTPGPGTPSATPEPEGAATLTSTPVDEISDTGGGWGTIFLWGFVLAGLVVVFRLLRVRGLGSQ
jgi:hypothetical protein